MENIQNPGIVEPEKVNENLEQRQIDFTITAEYFFCLKATEKTCNGSCADQCKAQNDLEKQFKKFDVCYNVLASGACSKGVNTCLMGFKCNCDIEHTICGVNKTFLSNPI